MITRQCFFCLIFFLGIQYIFGINIYESDMGMSIYINDTMMNVDIYDYSGDFLNHHRSSKIAHGIKRYLVIHGASILYFYNGNNKIEFSVIGGKGLSDWSDVTMITATSELKENNIIYTAQNLYNQINLVPWAEGVSGSGIGEKIRIELEPARRRPNSSQSIVSVFISNGFVDYNKPHLYEYNNRLKKIRVHNVGYSEYKDFELEDSPDIQYYGFGFQNESPVIEIEILEIYKGSRWDDTCVNFIIPFVW